MFDLEFYALLLEKLMFPLIFLNLLTNNLTFELKELVRLFAKEIIYRLVFENMKPDDDF